jgi:hypothetical protein
MILSPSNEHQVEVLTQTLQLTEKKIDAPHLRLFQIFGLSNFSYQICILHNGCGSCVYISCWGEWLTDASKTCLGKNKSDASLGL